MKYSTISGVVLDMDGVLWRGDQPLPGIVELFQWLTESNTPFALATNNSSRTRENYIQKLTKMGVPNVPAESIITSGTATADYLQNHYPAGTPIYVVGMDGLRHFLIEAGFDVSDEEPAQIVVAGIDFDLSYATLRKAALYIRGGAKYIGTNPDKTFPSPDGLVPGAGSILAALEAATDQEPLVIGKPGKPMFETALSVLGTKPENTLMVGDRLNTDVQGAQSVGLQTALVFTGVTTPQELELSDIWPDVAYEGLPELIKAWAGDKWYLDKMKAKRGR